MRFDRYPTANNPIAVPTDASNQEVSIDTQIAHFLRHINLEFDEYPVPREIPLSHQISVNVIGTALTKPMMVQRLVHYRVTGAL